MPRTSDTYQRVFEVADSLIEQGVRPTQQRIREQLGTGSISTINKALGDWWQQLGVRLKEQRSVPGLPDPVAETANKLWQQAMGYAERSFTEQSQEFTKKLREERNDMLADVDKYRQQAEDLRSQNDHLMQENALLLTDRRNQDDQIRQLEGRLIKLNSHAEDQARELKQNALLAEQGHISGNAAAPAPASEEMMQLKVDIRVKARSIEQLEDRIKSLETENSQLRQQQLEREQEAMRKQHGLELVIAQQDVRFEEAQRTIEQQKLQLES